MNKLVKLREVAEIVISNVDKKYNSDEKEITLCNYTDVYKNWAITLENSKSFMLATAKEKEIEKFILRKGQVAITKDSEKKDDIGIAAYISKNFNDTLLGYHCALITPNTEYLNGKFLNVFLHSKLAKKYFENQASGSGQRYSLSLESLNSLKIPLFNIGIQKKIGELYSNIDKKIELNNKINSELETMAKTIYDYWFLQFEFPNEEGKPYKSSGGKMVWNDELKREIPEGWEIKSIFDELSVQYGFPFATDKFTDVKTDIPVVRIRDILTNTISTYSNENVDEKYRLNEQDLLIGMDGNFHMNYWIDNTSYLNQRSVRLRTKDTSNVSIIQVKYNIAPYIKAKEERAGGSTVGHLSDKDLKELKILVPKTKKLREILDNTLMKIVKNRKENQELTSLRDFLLPLLMNGQVGFKEE